MSACRYYHLERRNSHQCSSFVDILNEISREFRLGSVLFIYLFIYLLLSFFQGRPLSYGSSQARGRIRPVAAILCHRHSNSRSEPCLWPTPSSQQCWIFNALSKARDPSCLFMDESQDRYHWAMMGTPRICFKNGCLYILNSKTDSIFNTLCKDCSLPMRYRNYYSPHLITMNICHWDQEVAHYKRSKEINKPKKGKTN